VAGLLTVLLHGGLLLLLSAAGLFEVPDHESEPRDLIQVLFAPASDAAAAPQLFSEQAPDRAEERPPDEPIALSNVQSRARDEIPGGIDQHLPRMLGSSDLPQVRMETPEPQGSARSSAAPVPLDPPRAQEHGAQPHSPTPAQSGQSADRSVGAGGLRQDAMSHPHGNAALPGDITLSTTAWEYAPWLQHFRRAVMQRWVAPMGFHLGLIHGWTLVELEIDRQGVLLRAETTDQQGHRALHDASLHAIQVAAPYDPLPETFPDNTLVIRIRMAYPEP